MISTRAPSSGPRGFFWQGLFILLPVGLLAVVGFYSLRQDRLLAETEARQTAQRHAELIARQVWDHLLSPKGKTERVRSFQFDSEGRLRSPLPLPPIPDPQPFDHGALTAEQFTDWRTAFAIEPTGVGRGFALEATARLLEAQIPEKLAALVRFRQGVLLAEAGRFTEAISALTGLELSQTEAVTASGLPVKLLAQARLLEIQSRSILLDTPPQLREVLRPYLDDRVSAWVTSPTFLTPFLLERALALARNGEETNRVRFWLQRWETDNECRALAERVLPFRAGNERPMTRPTEHSGREATLGIPTLFWLGSQARPGGTTLGGGSSVAVSDEDWIVSAVSTLDSGGPSVLVTCQRVGTAGKDDPIDATGNPERWGWEPEGPGLPRWYGVSLEVAGRPVIFDRRLLPLAPRGEMQTTPSSMGASSRGREPAPLAVASPPGMESLLRVKVHLVDAPGLFARQQARTRLFGLLIGASAVAAIIGFLSARNAFYRQQRLAEMKSNFVSSVSHELRAPIASVRLMAESLERGTVTDPARRQEYFRFIVQECRRLGTLIENVLDFARIEQGRKRYETEPSDVRGLIQATVKLMEPAAASRQVTLVAELPETAAAFDSAAKMDPQAMQQALINLIDNALKHSPAGSQVKVGFDSGPDHGRSRPCTGARGSQPTAEAREPNGASTAWPAPAELCLYVEDKGPGIPREEHERIFERFYRRGSELRRDTQGVGIGLSIVKHIVEAHGGHVRVESEPGHGSRFTIVLPLEGTKS
jgi:signal transduction histidine kinase